MEGRREADTVLIKIAGDVGYIRGKVDELADAKINHENRLRTLEDNSSFASGEKNSNNNRERIVTGVISVAFSALVVLAGAYIDRQPNGDINVNTTFPSNTGNSAPRPASNSQPVR